ncbi:PREDICTED: uncharacterized protein LOC104810179 [Tarenaya hassleriana]|uniref:uncharacterized protein LOC104810179 n=1 Tax=Tarenaya hassleriana TaxID=28532 RepID=UPI00053C8E15|nr:PREDICTED: uncharacterized protein LOC104810179 [Tarenaya hassleriana]
MNSALSPSEINPSTVHQYCQRIKKISDLLTNLDASVSERALVMHTLNGLSDKFDNIVNVIQHQKPFPSFDEARSMLSLEEQRLLRHRRPEPTHRDNGSAPTVLFTGSHPNQATMHSQPSYHHRNRSRGRGNRGNRGHRNNAQSWNVGSSPTQWKSHHPPSSSMQWNPPHPIHSYMPPWNPTGYPSHIPWQSPYGGPYSPYPYIPSGIVASSGFSSGVTSPTPTSSPQTALVTQTQPTVPDNGSIPTSFTPPPGLIQAFNATHISDPADASWYMDTGATTHLTSQPGSTNTNGTAPM